MRSPWLFGVMFAIGCLPSQPSGQGALSTRPSEWTWVEFNDTACANGTTTGLGHNPAEDTNADLVLFLSGGGACWDLGSCHIVKSAWNVELGYSAASFSSDSFRSLPLFDRANTQNPFRAAHYAFVPYCTGDLHVGTTEATYVAGQTFRHAGARNLGAFLTRLSATYASAKNVYVVGVSAGGFGAVMSAHRFRDAFPSATVHVLADSSALVAPSTERWTAWNEAWKPAAPPSCLECASTPSAWVTAARTSLGAGRLGLVTSDADGLLTTFLQRSDSEFRDGVTSLVDREFRTPRSAAFVVPGTRHVFLDSWTATVNGVSLTSWLTSFRDGEGFSTP